MLITRILSVLPNKFDHFHSAWDSVEEEKKTLDRLSTRLMTEEIRWKKDDQETSVALVTKGNNYKREQQKQSSKREYEKQGPSCFNYGKVGHLNKDCFRCFTCKRKGHTSKNDELPVSFWIRRQDFYLIVGYFQVIVLLGGISL